MTDRIGIDVGGTFTDLLAVDEAGRTRVCKVLSTPEDPSRGVIAGLAELAAGAGLALEAFLAEVAVIVHGTTVTTNAVLTGRTAATALLTTAGFRDALEMRRGIRERPYDNAYRAPRPIVARDLRLPVNERIDYRGEVVTPLDRGSLEAAIETLRARRVEAVAICFLHAHTNPAHEAAAAARVREALPELYCSVSSEVFPQVRFYERTSTTVLNAAVGPILERYLARLGARLAEHGFAGVLLVMQSNGGVTSPQVASKLAATTLLSGPAAAPAAGLAYATAHGCEDLITVDMGGTSFDALLIRAGQPEITTRGTVNRQALALPGMAINTVGAGGGSIGWIDEGGLLRMGPQSAGADPGPACYGRGGEAPTCSDADLLLGYLSADYFAGGRMRLDEAAARAAIGARIAAPLGIDVVAAAAGMVEVMNVNMAAAIEEITVERGWDPREFLMVCAGGAGPVHAAMIARELGIRRILVPRDSSIFCAAGMLHSDLKHDFVRSVNTRLERAVAGPGETLASLAAALEAEGRERLAAEGVAPEQMRFRHFLELRYAGQHHEVSVEVPGAALAGCELAPIEAAFHAAHNRLYGYDLGEEGTAVELISVRLAALGVTVKPPLGREPRAGERPAATAGKGRRAVYQPELRAFAECEVLDGDRLVHGNRIEGPAIIEQAHTTVWVPGGFVARCDPYGSFLLSDEAGS